MKTKKRGVEAKENKEKKRIRNESDQETEFDGDQSNEEMEEHITSISDSQHYDGENGNMEIHQVTSSCNPENGKRGRYNVKNGEIIISATLKAESCKIRGVNNLVKIVDISRTKLKPIKVTKTGLNTANLYYDKVGVTNEILDVHIKENGCDKEIWYKIAMTKLGGCAEVSESAEDDEGTEVYGDTDAADITEGAEVAEDADDAKVVEEIV
ncbi:hypothetical protein PV328_008426 [Microctonus aethiopoides]|uniref:Uncharacterized protein n=1 Tax=Microctonus aethiopoides TaxID=144406 RepID=A0AA39KR14_9HYME|nr:hypothetical protein PV328_008426 [Microctonus aethiopoides]